MSNLRYFSGASRYCIIEGEARFILKYLGSKDPLFQERIEFKENFINDLVVRLGDANLKIGLLLTAQKKYEEEKKKYTYLAEEISLEYHLLDDALETNLLNVAEILNQFCIRLRKKIPRKIHLFTKPNDLSIINKVPQKTYIHSRSFLFPKLNDLTSNGEVQDNYFHDVANRLQSIGDPVRKFRNKVLAHKYDKHRFLVHLSAKKYCEIRDALMETLDAVAIVGTFLPNDWTMTRSPEVFMRTDKWLVEGLIAAAIPIDKMYPLCFKDSAKKVQCAANPIDSK